MTYNGIYAHHCNINDSNNVVNNMTIPECYRTSDILFLEEKRLEVVFEDLVEGRSSGSMELWMLEEAPAGADSQEVEGLAGS